MPARSAFLRAEQFVASVSCVDKQRATSFAKLHISSMKEARGVHGTPGIRTQVIKLGTPNQNYSGSLTGLIPALRSEIFTGLCSTRRGSSPLASSMTLVYGAQAFGLCVA